MQQSWISEQVKRTGLDRKVAALGILMVLVLSAGCGSAPVASSPGKASASKSADAASEVNVGAKPEEKSSSGKTSGGSEPDQAMKSMQKMQKQMDIQMMPKDKKK